MTRRRVPHELKLLTNTYRPDRDGPVIQNAMPSFGDITPPDCLTKIGQEVWARTILTLLKLRVLSAADRDALLIYCQCWERKTAYDKALKDGETYLLPNGTQAIRPEAKRRDQCERQIEKFHKSYGMNAASRTALNVAAQGADRGMDSLRMYKLAGGTNPVELTEIEREQLIEQYFFSMDPQEKRDAGDILHRDPVYQQMVAGQEKPSGVQARDRNPQPKADTA